MGGHSLANYDITFKRFWGGQWVTLNISKQKILWKVNLGQIVVLDDAIYPLVVPSDGMAIFHFPFEL